MAEFLEKEVSLHQRLSIMKNELHMRFDWNLNHAFSDLDVSNDGFLNHRNIQLFLKEQNFYATDEELIAIVRRLDEDAD
jgi:Ca2+-binding EF-hand superfamily protein